METMEPLKLAQVSAPGNGALPPPCVANEAYNRCSAFGAALVCAEVYDSELCLHGAPGCLQAIREAYAQQNREYDYCQTGMNKQDVIFGGTHVLIAALLETMNPYEKAGPKIVVNACAPEIIGDDVASVIAKVNPNLPMVGVAGGFRGNQYWGINETLLQFVKKFADPYADRETGLVNLIGNVSGSRQWRADVRELIRLLAALGLTVNRLGCDNVFDDLRQASHAEATLLITPEIGVSAAEYLRDTFDLSVCSSPLGLPLGLRGTEVWLRAAGEQLHIEAERLEALFAREEEMVRVKLKVGLSDMVFMEKTAQVKHLPVAIIAEGVAALSWARFVAEEMEMRPCLIALRTPLPPCEFDPDLTSWLEPSDGRIVLLEPSVERVRQALAETRPHLVLGSSLEAEIARDLGLPAFLHITHPNSQYVNILEYPYLGYQGLLQVTQHILNRI
ncbi:MAG TPA: nitrogenase component 1 [Anaerolineae bacterium]|nr:nitrogenase component 1 [Anaerolineae bacterium]